MFRRRFATIVLMAILSGCGECSGCGQDADAPASPAVVEPAAQPDAAAAKAPAADAGAASEAPGAPGVPEGATPIERAVWRSFDYFRTRELRGDQAWAVRQTAALLGGDYARDVDTLTLHPDVNGRNNAETRMAELGKRSFAPLEALPLPDVPAAGKKVSPKLSDDQVRALMRMMQSSIDCTTLDARGKAKLLDDLRRRATGYLLSHQLWAAVTAHHLGCIDAATFEGFRLGLATRVYEELLADQSWNDLTAERAALLAYAGLAAWIPERIVELAVGAQRDDGSWPDTQVDVAPNVVLPEGHTVALSLYVLAHVSTSR